ncbi:ABC-type cobalamin/Fe3+-siderophore transport system, ATPase component [Halovivax ruber XH-70]|uniref:Cobalamin import ATP-binding protein BtuD n=1 Tax=Halovivax ruber (strain DSM 18193 / JCM 13892 / XH-70) TaxID=797302 RepID=L0I8P8_HALRX|nr:ATP-binding cassette domain-containing protein [Halovivax ruber]AGB15970.1 ABC-type cobalamin/Fe3+-siderophore transport system, ATPase component [Halovivax ruber XH-70]
MIDVDALSVSFGETPVLESLSVTIQEGKFVGLVGPNGAGKSTLLRSISGALSPDAGQISIDGTAISTLGSRAQSRLVSVVAQDTAPAFSFTVRHFVEMGRTPYRSKFSPPDERDRQRVDDALERTNTTQFADRSIDELSGGERQRVVVARALAQNTPVILLDEPTASLDINHQVELLSIVADLTAGGKTVVAAIHDLDLAARFCDELCLLADGSIVDRGSPAQVIETTAVERAFETPNVVTRNPVTGTPSVTAIERPDEPSSLPDRIHVLGTGPRTARLLTILSTTDAELSLGPVPPGDISAVTASDLDVPVQQAPAFSTLDAQHRHTLRSSLEAADAAVIVEETAAIPIEAVSGQLRALPTAAVIEEDQSESTTREGMHDVVLTDDSASDTVLDALTALSGDSTSDTATVSPSS